MRLYYVTDRLCPSLRSACFWCWWKEGWNSEQRPACFDWEYAVRCHRGCSSHGEEQQYACFFISSCFHISKLTIPLLLIGVFRLWNCAEDCNIWEKWFNASLNSILWYMTLIIWIHIWFYYTSFGYMVNHLMCMQREEPNHLMCMQREEPKNLNIVIVCFMFRFIDSSVDISTATMAKQALEGHCI